MKIKIVASHPVNDQTDIENLIGKTFLVKNKINDDDGKFTGRVHIDENGDGEIIIINPNEYEVVEE